MLALDMNRASQELVKAAEHLAQQPFVQGRGIGAIGFCMGGGLALTLACASPHVRAAAPFYGANPDPPDKVQHLRGPVLAIYAEHDDWVTPQIREQLRQALERHNRPHEIRVYRDPPRLLQRYPPRVPQGRRRRRLEPRAGPFPPAPVTATPASAAPALCIISLSLPPRPGILTLTS